ncbi:MAG TPA: hypothetical protein VGP05_12905 [Pseudonocardia sp.]|nr:hypothetical protein [Pseudonocardia sp.]
MIVRLYPEPIEQARAMGGYTALRDGYSLGFPAAAALVLVAIAVAFLLPGKAESAPRTAPAPRPASAENGP